ncbi:hypothetical protein C0992_011493, partial [Termitomyces sp. T32_za158]
SLLLRTTITPSKETINTLIDSGATDNFIDEAWAALAPGQQQELRLLVTKLHASAPLILGLPWLCSTNPRINWQSLTLHFERDATLFRTPVPFDLPVSLQTLRAPRIPGEESPTHSLLRSSSARLFVINTRL